METNNNNQTNEQNDDFLRLQDLWGLCLPRWRWFVLSVLICASAAVLYLLRTPNIHTRTASILIKEDAKGKSSNLISDFADMGGLFKSNTNIKNELSTIKSPNLMTEVVKRLRLNEVYSVREGLKRVELYGTSPVEVMMRKQSKYPFSFVIKLNDEHSFTLYDFKMYTEDGKVEYDKEVKGNIGKVVMTPIGQMTVHGTKTAREDFIGEKITYSKQNIDDLADALSTKLVAELDNKEGTVITLTTEATSPKKAEDILNTLIEVYNENWILDKNQIAISTSQFIGERLGVIEGELGHVDANISSFKSANLLPDVQAASALYMNQSAESKKAILELNSQLTTAQYIRHELTSKSIDQTLPTNSGIANANIETQINNYNNMVLDRNRLISNSSEANPLVQDLTSSLQSMQKTIVQSIDNLILSINSQINSNRQQEATSINKLASSPNQAKYLLSVERQQKVKEALYLYLLQKREENELSQAFTAYNTRVITTPRGSKSPTAPRKPLILLVAIVVGFAIPAVIIYLLENMNTKLRGRKDLDKVNVPFLGEIPLYATGKKVSKSIFFKKKKEKEDGLKTLVVEEGNRDVINEAFRVLRSNMDFMAGSDKHKNVLVMTSFIPGRG